mmetsp:Transcript_611/g.1907  ORF Transcript_611/g.1907 Transcript_611/m.1907 type:complete len:90 (-) Transcript_611:151-420(-)
MHVGVRRLKHMFTGALCGSPRPITAVCKRLILCLHVAARQRSHLARLFFAHLVYRNLLELAVFHQLIFQADAIFRPVTDTSEAEEEEEA